MLRAKYTLAIRPGLGHESRLQTKQTIINNKRALR